MDLKEYFRSQHGIGILSTADAEGRVDAAVYSRPHVFDNGTVAFVMRDRLTHHNVGQNAHALIAAMTRRHLTAEEDLAKGPKFLVTFAVEKVLPLIGAGQG